MIYLDNSATSFPKPSCVIDELNICLKEYCGNPGRSSHSLSLKSSEAIYEAREEIAALINAPSPEQVVFTYNATYALNLAIKTHVTEKCHILLSDYEHNSVIRPLERLKETLGISYNSFSSDGNVENNIRASVKSDTKGIVCSIASNVTGDGISLSVLSKVASELGLFLIIDASQAIGHLDIDISKTPCDVLCAPGHKALFGIQGCGFAYFKDKRRRESFIEGGSGSDSASLLMPELLPEAYEAGTLSTPAIVSLGRGVRFVRDVGIEAIQRKLYDLTEGLTELLYSIPKIRLYKSGNGILPFNIANLPSSYVARRLDEYGICVRGGLHCAPTIHKKLGTIDGGIVRLSFSYLNDVGHLYKVYQAIEEISKE